MITLGIVMDGSKYDGLIKCIQKFFKLSSTWYLNTTNFWKCIKFSFKIPLSFIEQHIN